MLLQWVLFARETRTSSYRSFRVSPRSSTNVLMDRRVGILKSVAVYNFELVRTLGRIGVKVQF